MQGNTAVGILYHQVVNLVNTTFERFHQSTSAYHSIKLHGYIGLAQLVEHQLLTKVLLFNHIVEMGQLVGTMGNGADQQRRFVVENGNLRRC